MKKVLREFLQALLVLIGVIGTTVGISSLVFKYSYRKPDYRSFVKVYDSAFLTANICRGLNKSQIIPYEAVRDSVWQWYSKGEAVIWRNVTDLWYGKPVISDTIKK